MLHLVLIVDFNWMVTVHLTLDGPQSYAWYASLFIYFLLLIYATLFLWHLLGFDFDHFSWFFSSSAPYWSLLSNFLFLCLWVAFSLRLHFSIRSWTWMVPLIWFYALYILRLFIPFFALGQTWVIAYRGWTLVARKVNKVRNPPFLFYWLGI